MDSPSRRSLILGKGGIGIAIKPALTRLRGRDDWMPARPRVFAGVLIRRAVATQRHATLLAGAQMHPLRPDLHTLRALAAVRSLMVVMAERWLQLPLDIIHIVFKYS